MQDKTLAKATEKLKMNENEALLNKQLLDELERLGAKKK